MAKTAVLEFLNSSKFISRKILSDRKFLKFLHCGSERSVVKARWTSFSSDDDPCSALLFSFLDLRNSFFFLFSLLVNEWVGWVFFVIAFLMIVRLLSNKRDLFARAWYQSWGKNPWLGKCPSAWNGNHSSSSSSVSKWFHNVEISGFTWNQFWSFWTSKICHFDHIVQTTVFDILKSAKIDFT